MEVEKVSHGRWDKVGGPNKQCLSVRVKFIGDLRHLAKQKTEVGGRRLVQSTVVCRTQGKLGRITHGRWDGGGVFTHIAFITTSEDLKSSDTGLTLMVV